MVAMNEVQRETLDMLLSEIDGIEVAPDELPSGPTGVFVFEGQGVDGPCCGYIELDGKVTWIAGG